MTLILSCLTERYAIQVSDRRITGPDGTLIDDYENKATQYGNLMAFAFSGCAYIGGRRTHVWLMNALASTQSLLQAVNQVATRATEEFKKIPPTAPFRQLAIVGVGWSNNSDDSDLLPTFVTISNALENSRWVAVTKEKFDVVVYQLDMKVELLPPVGQTVSDD